MSTRFDPKTGKLLHKAVIRDMLLCSLSSFIIAGILYYIEVISDFFITSIIAHIFSYCCLFLSILVWRQYPNVAKWKKSLFSNSLGMLIAMLLSSLILELYGAPETFMWVGQPAKVVIIALTMAGFFCYFFYSRESSADIKRQIDVVQLQKAQHDKSLLESQLKTLQCQIEPHFLFNTLANIQAMIHHDPKIATELLTNLTDLLRQSLKKSRLDSISISDEVSFLRAYLEIQKIRLGVRLTYDIEVTLGEDESLTIPPLLIQPLVENAIKHGLEPKISGGQICICFSIEGSQLVVSVQDSGVGLNKAHTQGNGIALNNIRNRLNSLYAEHASLTITEIPQQGVCALVKLPTETKPLSAVVHAS